MTIVEWLQDKVSESGTSGYVVGVSGGIDSALTSTLCALTGRQVIVVGLPIHQPATHVHRSETHMSWLENNFSNVSQKSIDLTYLYEAFRDLDMDM